MPRTTPNKSETVIHEIDGTKKNNFILLTNNPQVKNALWAMNNNKNSDQFCDNDWRVETQADKIIY